jgi:hypothetical protein
VDAFALTRLAHRPVLFAVDLDQDRVQAGTKGERQVTERGTVVRGEIEPMVGVSDANAAGTNEPGRLMKPGFAKFALELEVVATVRGRLGGRAIRQQDLLLIGLEDQAGSGV